eukprot:COSAG05_NODE_5717_length_1108_cov_1.573835_1_plen_224_part_01
MPLFRDVSWASATGETPVHAPAQAAAVGAVKGSVRHSAGRQRQRSAGMRPHHRPRSARSTQGAALGGGGRRRRPASAGAGPRRTGSERAPTLSELPRRPTSACATTTRSVDMLDVSGVIRRLQRYHPPTTGGALRPRWDGCNIFVPRTAAPAAAWSADEAAVERQRVLQLKNYAAIVIQCSQRQRSARALLKLRRRRGASAVCIQSHWKGHAARRLMGLWQLST